MLKFACPCRPWSDCPETEGKLGRNSLELAGSNICRRSKNEHMIRCHQYCQKWTVWKKLWFIQVSGLIPGQTDQCRPQADYLAGTSRRDELYPRVIKYSNRTVSRQAVSQVASFAKWFKSQNRLFSNDVVLLRGHTTYICMESIF